MLRHFLSTIKIRGKIRFVTWLASTLALLLITFGYGFYQNETERAVTASNMAIIGALFASNVGDPLYNLDADTARTQLASARLHPRIFSVCILDQDNKLFAAGYNTNLRAPFDVRNNLQESGVIAEYKTDINSAACPYDGLSLPRAAMQDAILTTSGERTEEIQPYEIAHHVALMSYPISYRGTVYGTLYMIYALPLAFETLLAHIPFYAALFIIGMVLAVMLADMLQNHVSGPIGRVAATIRRISEEKNFSMRLVKSSSDEIGDVIDHFNTMLDEIELRDKELRESRFNLENVILGRTRELEKARTESQQAQDFMNQIINAIPDPVCVKDNQLRYIAGSHAFNSLFTNGLIALGKTDAEIFTQAEAEALRKSDLRVLEEGAGTSEMHFPLKHGLMRTFVARKVRVKGRDGRTLIVSTLRNVSGDVKEPKAPAATPVPKPDITAIKPVSTPLNILVVEDNPINERVAHDVFAMLGHAVDIATTSQDALQKSLHKKYHAIFLDTRMAYQPGNSLTKELRLREKEANMEPALLVGLTSAPLDTAEEEALRADGLDAILAKPLMARPTADLLVRFSTHS